MANSAIHNTGYNPAGQLFLSGAGMWPTTTNGASGPTQSESTTNKVNTLALGFADGSTILNAQCSVMMPSDWGATTSVFTITATFVWTKAGTSTNGIAWQCQARAFGDNVTIDQAFGTNGIVIDNGSSTALQVQISSASSAITVAGSPAASQFVQYNISRDPTNASDTLADTGLLLGVMITYQR